jgi:hypothetical protein
MNENVDPGDFETDVHPRLDLESVEQPDAEHV